uniref:Phenylethanolamine N-methyltransferase n=1 Tax=Astyanax mexicanus TaxID=7994 RepID=W5L7N2_ASTMX
MEGKDSSEEAVAAIEACYQGFNPAAYLQYNYTPPRADFQRSDSIVPWKLSCLHKAFSEGEMPLIIYAQRNDIDIPASWIREETAGWVKCALIKKNPTAWTEKAERLRSVVTDVLPINVHQPCPLPAGSIPSSGADCLVSSFCLESVSPDLPSFTRALGHLSGLLRSGGHLLLIGALGESFYLGAPGLQIPVVPLDEAQVCSSLRTSGYQLLQLSVYHLPPDMRVGVDDVSGVFFAKARKP